jgi:hypothetical protein
MKTPTPMRPGALLSIPIMRDESCEVYIDVGQSGVLFQGNAFHWCFDSSNKAMRMCEEINIGEDFLLLWY